MGSALGFLPSTIRSCGDTGRPRRTSSGCRPFQARSRSFCLAMPRCDLWSDHEVTAPRQPARRREPRGASSRRPLLREPLGNARGRPILAPALTRSVALPPATPSRGPGCGRWRRRSSGRMCGRLDPTPRQSGAHDGAPGGWRHTQPRGGPGLPSLPLESGRPPRRTPGGTPEARVLNRQPRGSRLRVRGREGLRQEPRERPLRGEPFRVPSPACLSQPSRRPRHRP